MADSQNNETLRSLLAGFNQMQANAGLLPVQTGQMPMGVSLNSPPQMMAVPSPGDFAASMMAQQQSQMQQTIAAAQMTRFSPPPSAQMNPFAAAAFGGGGGGMPNPMFFTSPQFGMYRPPTGGVPMPYGPMRVPNQFNPFAPSIGAPHFATPAMHALQVSRAYQAQNVGSFAGMVEGGLGIGGSILGTAVGSMLGGPIGGFIGGWAGQHLGGMAANMTIGPALDDIRRGRLLQNTTAPWMVTGPNLDPFTGQGLSRSAGRDTAFGLRHLARDYDFGRTGFNTQDVMKITQLASDQGLLQTAQHPDEIVRKVKDISKSVKALIQITGDPDVRNAIAGLGEMRRLGFEGLGNQAGAMANRTMFSRMAGVSQADMHAQFGMPGAMMAQGMGLAGATGYNAGMAGAGVANVAISGGAFNDMQLARAGGRQGLSQILTQAALGGVNQSIFMGAALRSGPGGQLTIDPEAYRKAMTMSVSEATQEAAHRTAGLSQTQLMAIPRLQQEFKDKLASSMTPMEMQLNIVRQAQGLMKNVPGMDLGGAFQAMMGNDTEAARALELTFKPSTFRGLEQQLNVQRRNAMDRVRAAREQYRTPGLLTRGGRAIREGLGSISDSIVDPFARAMEASSQIQEDNAALSRGERIQRLPGEAVVSTARDRQLAAQAAQAGAFSRVVQLADAMPQEGAGGFANSFFASGDFTTLSSDAQRRRLLMESKGHGGLFGKFVSAFDVGGTRGQQAEQLTDIGRAAGMIDTAMNMKASDVAASATSVQGDLGRKVDMVGALRAMRSKLSAALPRAGFTKGAGALHAGTLKRLWVETLMGSGVDRKTAETYVSQNAERLGSLAVADLIQNGGLDKKQVMEVLTVTQNIRDKIGSAGSLEDLRHAAEADLAHRFDALGVGHYGDNKALQEHIADSLGKSDVNLVARALMERSGGAGQSALDKMDTAAGRDAKQRLALQSQAAAAFSALPEDVRKALGNMRGGDIADRLTAYVGGVAENKATAGATTNLEKIARSFGINIGNKKQMLAELAKRGPKALGPELYEAAKKGDVAGALGVAAGMDISNEAASGTSVVSGGTTDQIERDMTSLRKLSETVGDKGDPQDKMMAQTATVLGDAASDLRATAEQFRLLMTNPNFTALLGGGQ